jgi:Phosphotyrosyl phosphate activator (PTPA) protein
MLNGISSSADWQRVVAGLFRLFQEEVLFKFPVVQHVVFGSILPCTWEPSLPLPTAPPPLHGAHALGVFTVRPSAMGAGIDPNITVAPWARK